MKKILHRSEDRGGGDYGWLKTRYSFSFANWYNPSRMGFGALRVINDDIIAPDSGFGAHAHKDMEIITLVTSGAVTHTDSIGNTGTVPAGDVQVMSAGSGVTHSEFNASTTEPLTLFQIWIQSEQAGIAPRYGQKSFEPGTTGTTLLVSPDGREDSLGIKQQAFISRAYIPANAEHTYTLKNETNGIYIFVISGEVTVASELLRARDALGLTDVSSVQTQAASDSELLIIEVPI